MKILAKTKVFRVSGGEVYLRKTVITDGYFWEVMHKDLSSICGNRDTKFSARGYGGSNKPPSQCCSGCDAPVRPLPADFDTDLLGPYDPVAYCEGHKPIPSFRF